ncbi:hypothetical protein FN846DRAFT_893249 [Sphaerosporella brunnea]|uniref:Uncharacterized protein n=1 Tax=Sphaerosporella brunnea TaxID=1250544 RepID=A0A5J5EMM9_9PEZI|nr:hypothetical protein FN846DRAFT_893249 [Sphaerosporella brunnea]
MIAKLLPPALRPPVLERFQHRQNQWAIQRRTADVNKLIARMERQLGAVQPQLAPPQASPVWAIDTQEEPERETLASTTAKRMPHNTGGPSRPTVSTPEDCSRPASFVGCTPSLDPNALSTVHDPSTSEDALTPAEEIDAVVRVGILSPGAAMRMTRLVEKLKSDRGRQRILKKVTTTFLNWVNDGVTCSDIGFGGMSMDTD